MADKFIEKIAESPVKALDGVTDIIEKLPAKKSIHVARKYWGTLGPGLTSGASGDDPSGIASYSQVGAQFGLKYLWLALYTTPFMIVVQEMCARLSQVTGRGITGVLKQHYSRRLVYFMVFLLFIANTISIGADLGGMVAATRLLLPGIPFTYLAVFFTVLSLFLQIKLSYETYFNMLKFLTLILFAYVATAFFIQLDWIEVMKRTLTPSLSFTRDDIMMVTAVIGATLSPYLLFWQSSQEVEQEKGQGRTTITQLQGTNSREIRKMRIDVATGMVFSNLIMFFIIAVTGSILFSQGIQITTAADAANALRPLAGDYAYLLFAGGLIGTGMLAMPVLAGSVSYAFAEAFSVSQGLDKTLKQASAFYGVIIIAMLLGLGMNFLGIDPIQALIFAAIINGLVTPLVLTLILLVCNNQKIMGKWKNGVWSNGLGWLIVGFMYLAGIGTLVSLFI